MSTRGLLGAWVIPSLPWLTIETTSCVVTQASVSSSLTTIRAPRGFSVLSRGDDGSLHVGHKLRGVGSGASAHEIRQLICATAIIQPMLTYILTVLHLH